MSESHDSPARKRRVRRAFRYVLFLGLTTLLSACSSDDRPAIVRQDEPGYTGLERCALCHTNLYGEWKRSLHSKAMGVPADSTVVGDFGDVRHTYGGVTSRMYRDETGYYMETLGLNGEIQPFRVDYTIGVRQHQAYLTTFPDGRLQVLPLYHDGEKGAWVDAQEGRVVQSDKPLRPGDFYFWANRGRSWNYHCYDCHASRVHKHYDYEADRYETTVGNLTIDCEACHGPGKLHDQTLSTPGGDLNIVELERLPVDEQIEVCAQCHAAKEIISKGYAAGKPFYDHYTLHLPDHETFYPDGQPRVYLYPAALHLMSSCYTEGDLICTSCHDPHGSDHEVDLIADRRTTALCESCHQEIAADPTVHSRHKLASDGNTCVGCHMPYHRVTGEKMTDHRIASPSPRNTELFGVPNSCNAADCHADKSAKWASEYVDEWFPDFQDREAEFVQPYFRGKTGRQVAIGPLRERLRDPSTGPVWKAVAATLLGKLAAQSAVDDLVVALSDPYPMVRIRSAVALGRIGDVRGIPPLAAALTDSIRSVRIYTAFALLDLGYLPPSGEAREALDLALAEYEKMVADLHQDDPGLLDGLGELRERSGAYGEARQLFQRVRKLDPGHPETESDLVRITEREKRFAHGEPILRRAVESLPEDFGSRARLGGFYDRHHRTEAAGLQLRGAAVKLSSPSVLLAEARTLAAEGDVEGAIKSVLKALDASPRHRSAARDLALLVLSSSAGIQDVLGPSPQSAWGWWVKGHQLTEDGRLPQARHAFSQSLSHEAALLAADSSDVHGLVGLTRGALSQLDAWAERTFEHGRAAFQAGNLAEAERYFGECISLSPADSRGYLLLSLVLDAGGRDAEAASAALEGSVLDPDLADWHGVLGSLSQKAGRVNEAVTYYETALALNPRTPGIHLNLGQLYMVQGKKDSALVLLKRLLAVDPANQPARQILSEIEG